MSHITTFYTFDSLSLFNNTFLFINLLILYSSSNMFFPTLFTLSSSFFSEHNLKHCFTSSKGSVFDELPSVLILAVLRCLC